MEENLLVRLASLEAEVRDLRDREAIRVVLYQYARAADRCDLDLFKRCYHSDATDAHWFFNGDAHEFAEYVIPLLRRIPATCHAITNAIIEIEGDQAFVESQWHVIHRIDLSDGVVVDQQAEGRYLDVFERRAGAWKIRHRQVVLDMLREFVVPESHAALPPDALGQRGEEDPVYRRFRLGDPPPPKSPGIDLWGPVRAAHGARDYHLRSTSTGHLAPKSTLRNTGQ